MYQGPELKRDHCMLINAISSVYEPLMNFQTIHLFYGPDLAIPEFQSTI